MFVYTFLVDLLACLPYIENEIILAQDISLILGFRSESDCRGTFMMPAVQKKIRQLIRVCVAVKESGWICLLTILNDKMTGQFFFFMCFVSSTIVGRTLFWTGLLRKQF